MEKVAKFNFVIRATLLGVAPQARVELFALNMPNPLREVGKKFFYRLPSPSVYLSPCVPTF